MVRTCGTTKYTSVRVIKKAVQQGRIERKAEAYSLEYVEGLSDARTKLADFFSILLVGGEVRMKAGWMAAVVMIGVVSMVGCVSQKKYEEASIAYASATDFPSKNEIANRIAKCADAQRGRSLMGIPLPKFRRGSGT